MTHAYFGEEFAILSTENTPTALKGVGGGKEKMKRSTRPACYMPNTKAVLKILYEAINSRGKAFFFARGRLFKHSL